MPNVQSSRENPSNTSTPNGVVPTNEGSNHSSREHHVQQGTTKIPDIVENTPEHSICSSIDHREDLDSHNIRLTVDNQNTGAKDISIQMECSKNNDEHLLTETSGGSPDCRIYSDTTDSGLARLFPGLSDIQVGNITQFFV